MAVPTTRAAFKEYCLKNKYSNWYFNIIETALNRGWTKKTAPCYVEKHHYIPRSIGGTNKHLVCLTAREHFVCHLLLTKMVESNDKIKMNFALHRLVLGNTKNYCKNSFLYEKIKLENSKSSSLRNKIMWSKFSSEQRSNMRKGEKNGRFGKEVTQITRQKISAANKGKLVGDKHPLWQIGHSEETRKKISKSKMGMMCGSKNPMFGKQSRSFGKKWYNNGVQESYFVIDTQPKMWSLGRLKRT